MANQKITSQNSGIMLVVTYFILFLVNAVIIYLANFFFPQILVLGTLTIPFYWAIIHSAGVLALFDTFAIPFAREYENVRGKMLTSIEWMAIYFIINFVGFWVIARFPEQFGMGIKSWMVAFAIAVILDFLQGIVMMQLENLRQKTS